MTENLTMKKFGFKKLFRNGIFVITLIGSPLVQAMDFSVDGYYRLRFEYTHDLDLQKPNPGIVPGDLNNNSNDRIGTIAFGQQRFRMNPRLKLNDNITFHGQIDLLDNLLFGQSDIRTLSVLNPLAGTISMPNANGAFGVVGTSAGDIVGSGGGNVNVRRLWVDILTSAGQFRIGRQPSHFGLGIFNNDGDGMEGDFGNTYDRILYLAGLEFANGHRLNFGVVYDFAFEAQRDPSITGFDVGFDSNFNDIMQGGILLLYQTQNLDIGLFGALRYRDGNDGDTTTTATYIDNCNDDGRPSEYVCADPSDTTDSNYDLDNDGQINDGIELPAGVDGDTFLYIVDFYAKYKFLNNYKIGFEGVYIGGKIATGLAIDAIVLDADSQAGFSNPLTAPIELPLTGTQNDIEIFMAAMEFDADWSWGGELKIQAGYASGDGKPLSSKITQLGFRPDYDIALILFDQPLGTSPAIVIGGQTELGRKPMSPNYINNAVYATIGYKHEFDITSGVPWADDFKVGLKFITAYAPADNLDLDFTEVTGVANLPYLRNSSRWYGWEVDASVEATFFDHLKWKSTAGVFVPGALYDIKNDNGAVDSTGFIDSILFDKADLAVAFRTTLFFQF